MASEISHRHTATAKALYATIRNMSRQMRNTAGTPAFEALTVANWADYDHALSETPAASYFYVGDFPAGIAAGWYWLDIFEQAGGSPAISDTLLASYFGYWDGTIYRFWADDATHFNGALQPTSGEVTPAAASKTGYALSATGLDAIVKMKALLDGTETGTVNDATPAVTGFKTSLQPASAAFFDGGYLQFTSGAQLKQARLLDGCTLDGGYLVVAWAAGEDNLTAAPANGDAFLIIGRSK